tara:strand:- start:3636 stop:12281 length:8646 start_codon:yes stop_codon:yes gene_type:complete
MPTQEAIRALSELRKRKQQNSIDPFSLVNAYNLNAPNPLVERLSQEITGETDEERQSRIEGDKVNLFQSIGAGLYEFGETASFGLLGLAEIGAERALGEEIEFQEYFREAQEESSLAAVLGGIGTGAGFLLGAPMKLTARVLQRPATRALSALTKRQTIGQASKELKTSALKKGVDKDVINSFTNVLKGTSLSATTKGKLADKTFRESFTTGMNTSIARKLRRGEITKDQASAIGNMSEAIAKKGVPLQNLSQYSRIKFGNSRLGRFATEALHDAFIFSVADGVLDASLQSQQLLKGEQSKFDLGQTGYAITTGLLAGTAINAATSPFGPLGKMMKSRTDFKQGLRAYLSGNRYKGLSLEELSSDMADVARHNKANGRSTDIGYKVDGEDRGFDLLSKDDLSQVGNARYVAGRLREDLGDGAEKKAMDWLMAEKKYYGKQIMNEATREGFDNYRLLFPRMMVAGAVMSGVQGVQAYATGNELRVEDYISSMLIGAWTQRRGNFARSVDLGTNINKLRQTLDHLGIESDQTFYASTFSRGNNRFGVGLARDNEELNALLREERIVSDDDESITSEPLPEGERSFLDLESGFPNDPHDGKMNIVYQLMSEDFKYTKDLTQISERQAKEIINLLDRQGFKTADDFDKAFEERVSQATLGLQDNIANVLHNIRKANFDEISISVDKDKNIVVPNSIDINKSLKKRARDGEYKDWLDGKEGQEAVEELNKMGRSYQAVTEFLNGLDKLSYNVQDTNQIQSSDTLKDFYNIIRDAEKGIDDVSDVQDGRKEFRFTDTESYVLPVIQNYGKQVTKNIISTLSRDNLGKTNLMALLQQNGIINQKFQIIDDISKIPSDYADKVKDLGRVHNVLRALGEFEITDKVDIKEVPEDRIKALKFGLKDAGLDLDMFNKPKTRFLYQMVLNDINRTRLDNSVVDPGDIDFIVQVSGNAILSEPGLLTDQGVRGFTLKKVDIPSDRELERKYNAKLDQLNEDTKGLVDVIDKRVVLNEPQGIDLKTTIDAVYAGTDKTKQNLLLNNLFEVLTLSKVDMTKNRMISYMESIGNPAQTEIMIMLKRQGIIKRNVDGDFELTKKFTLEKIMDEVEGPKNQEELAEKMQEIKDVLEKRGYTSKHIQDEIKERQKIERRYVSDASDVVKNPSISIDQFFNKYKFKVEIIDGASDYNDYSSQTSEWKSNFFNDQRYLLDEFGNLSQQSINRIKNDIVLGNTEFKNLSADKQESVLGDIVQVVRGLVNRKIVRRMSIRNGDISFDPAIDREIMQKNPVFDYFDKLGMDYAIFDNNVVYTDFGDYITDKTYNILSTEGLGDKEIESIERIRARVTNQLRNRSLNQNISSFIDEDGIVSDDAGIVKLDIYDGMDSIVIDKIGMENIVDDFKRFYDDHYDKIDNEKTKKVLKKIRDNFDEVESRYDYNEVEIESAARFLVLEVALKSDSNEKFYKAMSENNPIEVEKYLKRIKLVTTKNFIRPDNNYYKALLQARVGLKASRGKDKPSQLLKRRLKIGKHRVAIWNDSTENMTQIINDLRDDFPDIPELANYSLKNIMGDAHAKVSGFDSIAFIPKDGMMEYHALMGHDPNSKNPIKPIISSQGEGKTLLYGKTLFVHSPSLENFFKNNKVDILITKSGAKVYDSKFDEDGKDISLIEDTRWKYLDSHIIDDRINQIRNIDLDGIGFRPEKDSDLLSASESDADYNYMNRVEHRDAFRELVDELTSNLNQMESIMADPYKMNSFMREQLDNNNIPQDSEDGALKNLGNLVYYLQLNDAANPYDYSSNQVQKYLSKVYIDNVFSKRRANTNRVYSESDADLATDSFRYGGQAYLIQTATGYQGAGRMTRLLPTLFDRDNNMILRGQINLPHAERSTSISSLPNNKNIRVVANERILTLEELKNELKSRIEDEDDDLTIEGNDIKVLDNFFDEGYKDATIESMYDFLKAFSEASGTRYELGIISRRNPRTRPNDITLLGLKGFLDKDSGLGVEINSFDIANVYEGDYDADKVDYFFAHSDYMFDYIKRNQAFFVQGIDPEGFQEDPTFTFQLGGTAQRDAMLSKMGNSIAFKRGIGIVQKTPRKLNYVQNVSNKDHLLFDNDNQKKQILDGRWSDTIRENKITGELEGPSKLFQNKDGEFVTIDTESLAFYQRAAVEVQYIVDGQNKLNKKIADNIYDWVDKFLFPDKADSISPSSAKSEDLKEILANGRNADGKRVRIFEKYKLNEETNKYEPVNLNGADKLVVKELLNQQNKLLNAFGDDTYVAGEKRKTSFYDLAMGSKVFREFHKDIYKSMARQLYYKKRNLDKSDRDYLEDLLSVKNKSFDTIKDNMRGIYDGDSGNYLDRIAVDVAKRDLLNNKKEYHLDTETYSEIENWFEDLVSRPTRIERTDDEKVESSLKVDDMPIEDRESFVSSLDKLSKGIVDDTKKFNMVVGTIKRLESKKKWIRSSKYASNWKKKKISNIDWVVNKLQKQLQTQHGVAKKKLHPSKLKYKRYISVEDSDIKNNVIHANTMNAFLRNNMGMRYDSWWETLSDTAKEDLKALTDLNKQTYGKGTLLDELLPYKETSIVKDKKMLKFIEEHSTSLNNLFELKQRYLLNMIQKHKINFLYAYMEPRRNRDDIGVFNNRPIAIPYKDSGARFREGIRLLAAIANGSDKIASDVLSDQQTKDMAEFVLKGMIESNEHYRRFFDKDVSLMDLNNSNMETFGLMPFDKKTRLRLNQDGEDFSWLSEMLPSNPFSTINKSVIRMYSEYIDMLPNKNKGDYENFMRKLNDLEEFSARKDYVNPVKYMNLRLSLDQDFLEIIKKDIYNVAGDSGLPESLVNNPMFSHIKFLEFKPKQVKSSAKIGSMLKTVSKMHQDLMTSARQNPMRDSGYETYKMMGEYLEC